LPKNKLESNFKTAIGLLTHLPGMHYLHIPAKVVKQFGGTLPIRVICRVNDCVEFQGGMVNLKEGDAYITFSRSRMNETNAKLGDTVTLSLITDTSEFGTEVPEELAVLFEQDFEGKMRFDLLKKSMQRYILNYVNSVKSIDKRIERATLLVGNLKQLQLGKETFREMLGLPKERE